MDDCKAENSQSKIPKKKILQSVLTNFAILGIQPDSVAQPCLLNGRILIGFCSLGLAMIGFLNYLIYEAETFIEYTQTVYIESAVVTMMFILMIIILNVEKIFKFMENCEQIVNMCRCNIQSTDAIVISIYG